MTGMRNPKIAQVLKYYRKLNRFTVAEVSQWLGEQGIIAAPKTVYGWESGQTQPAVDTLFILCGLYHIDDALAVFGYKSEDENSVILSGEEKKIVLAYRSLSDMREAVKKLLSI